MCMTRSLWCRPILMIRDGQSTLGFVLVFFFIIIVPTVGKQLVKREEGEALTLTFYYLQNPFFADDDVL